MPIPYAPVSWNPVSGCSNTPDQCECHAECWARIMANRMAANPTVKHRERYEGFEPAFWPERLGEPLRRKKPSMIAVGFMSDMFSEGVPWQWQVDVFNAVVRASKHTYLFLTKRPEVMSDSVQNWLEESYLRTNDTDEGSKLLDNSYFGTTITDQPTADERIPSLQRCPGRHWLSVEPLRGEIKQLPLDGIGWVVGGGGPWPVPIDVYRSIRYQCKDADVPFYLKQITNERGRRIKWEDIPEDLQVREMPR
jgi:protein gp37